MAYSRSNFSDVFTTRRSPFSSREHSIPLGQSTSVKGALKPKSIGEKEVDPKVKSEYRISVIGVMLLLFLARFFCRGEKITRKEGRAYDSCSNPQISWQSIRLHNDKIRYLNYTKSKQMKTKPQLSFWQIWNMSFGFLGIQFGFALQGGFMSSIFVSLGASKDEIPLLWIAAPLTGLIVQPIIGYFSDRTWHPRLGRRRPFFLIGAVLASIVLFFCASFPHAMGGCWMPMVVRCLN